MSKTEKLEVKMTFDDKKMKELGYTKQGVYRAIKRAYEEKGIVCTADDDVLAFQDTGKWEDYGKMWSVISALMREDWYVACATSCTFEDEEGTEDVLSQAWKYKR